MKKITLLLWLGVLVLTGCNKTPEPPTPFPEVDDANCDPGVIMKMVGKDRQQQFSDLCLRRGSYKVSPKRTY